jgi:tRNA nucleotidyltransferase/poly(A) polymerase
MNMKIEEWLKDARYDDEGMSIMAGDRANHYIADLRGWGKLLYLFPTHDDALKFQDSVGEFIVQAIIEKLERKETK